MISRRMMFAAPLLAFPIEAEQKPKARLMNVLFRSNRQARYSSMSLRGSPGPPPTWDPQNVDFLVEFTDGESAFFSGSFQRGRDYLNFLRVRYEIDGKGWL